MKKSLLALTLLVSSTANAAINGDYVVHGVGNARCGLIVDLYEVEEGKNAITDYVSGYLTAKNERAFGMTSILDEDMTVEVYVEHSIKACKDSPQNVYSDMLMYSTDSLIKGKK